MPIYKGNKNITKVYQGEQEIDKVYRGASKVYGADKGTEITVSGNPLVLTNVAKEKALDTLEINGRTEQVQLSGKNLFNAHNIEFITYNSYPSGEQCFSDITDNGLTIITKGVNHSYLERRNIFRFPQNDVRYTLSFDYEWIDYTSNSTVFRIAYVAKDDTPYNLGQFSISENIGHKTFTIPAGAKGIAFGGWAYSGTVKIFNIQIEQGTSVTSYEQYCGGTPSPNPAYPQEIVNVNALEVVARADNKPIHIATIDGIELTKWDKVVKRNGVWGVLQYGIVKKILPSDISYTGKSYNNETSSAVLLSKDARYTTGIGNCYCSHSKVVFANVWDTRLDLRPAFTPNVNVNWGGCFALRNSDVGLTDYSNNTAVLNAYKQWVTENDVYIALKRNNSEAEFIPLSQTIQDQLNALQIYKPTTVVTNNAECEMSAKYLCYLDNAEAMLTSLYNSDLSEVLK